MWQAAEELMAEVDQIVPKVRYSASNATDHLERSAESALFNIGEGAGAFQPRVKIACYEIAKKELNEVRAVLRRLLIKGVLTRSEASRAYNIAGATIGMLTRAIITLEERAGR